MLTERASSGKKRNKTWKMQTSGGHLLAVVSCLYCGVVTLVSEAASNLPPDHTGLVGAPPAPDKPILPLRFWANPRKSPLKPRRKDLNEVTLLRLMGQDFDSKWMRRTPPIIQGNEGGASEDRKTVRALKELMHVQSSLELPHDLPAEYHEMIKSWMVRRATCPIHYIWDDLGPYFWPRWIRRGECGKEEKSVPHLLRNSDIQAGNSTDLSCSWPPGMYCVPGVARNLNILRWHCRLRKKNNNNNNVWSTERLRTVQEQRKKKRKKYRCFWLKVPYPVPEDCVCSC